MSIKRRKDFGDWRDDFSDIFEDFGFDFDRWNEHMMKTWDKMLRDPDVKTFGPYVYGFTYKLGPDGKPKFEEFGNAPYKNSLGNSQIMGRDVREPLTDINVDDKNVYITYELPGISKDNIDLSVSEHNVTISVENGPRKYYKSLDFEYNLTPNKCIAKFTNGVLDVTVEKEKKSSDSGKRITIE